MARAAVAGGSALHARALRLLARKERSRHELAGLLSDHGAAAEVSALLDMLEQRGALSEARLADQLLHKAAGRFGAHKIEQQLNERGVEPALKAATLERIRSQEQQNAHQALAKRFGEALPASRAEWARRARFLTQRGFSEEIIERVLGGDPVLD